MWTSQVISTSTRSALHSHITSKGRMAGAFISDVKTELEGERVGNRQQ
jgi:hypothetical protein